MMRFLRAFVITLLISATAHAQTFGPQVIGVPVSVNNGGTGSTTTPSNGQVPIGNGTNYVPALITAGANITITPGAGSLTIAASGGTSTLVAPQGRLTLQSTHPVQNADQAAATTIYYDSYVGNQVPVYNGATWSLLTITSNEISLGLNATLATGLYDVYGFSNSGTLALCYGPKWSTVVSRASAPISLQSGIWTNTNAYSSTCIGGASGTTTFSISANQGTYLGSFYVATTGQTLMVQAPAANTIATLGVYNAYNRVWTVGTTIYSAATSWTETSTSWTLVQSGAIDVVAIDGLGQSNQSVSYTVSVQSSLTSVICAVGINAAGLGVPVFGASNEGAVAATGFVSLHAEGVGVSQFGRSTVQPYETASGSTCTFENPAVAAGSGSYNSSGVTFGAMM